MPLFRDFFERRSNLAGTAVARAASGSLVAGAGEWGFGGPMGDWDIEKAVDQGVKRVIWVFRSCDAIASSQSKLPIILRRDDPISGEVVKPGDDSFAENFNTIFNRRPNIYESAKMLRYRLSFQLLLSQKGAFIEVVKTNGGGIDSIHLLPPHRVRVVPDAEKFVSEFIVSSGYADQQEYRIPAENVIWIRLKAHPLDPYLQLTPMVAAGLAADIDYYSHMFNRNFVFHDGRPGMIVAVKGRIQEADAETLRRRYGGGPATAGQVSVVEADGVEVADTSSTPRDAQWLDGIQGSKNDIFTAFGTPESVMGNASGRTFDNADVERENYYVDTVVDHCDGIATGLDVITPGGVSDNLYPAYFYDGVEVLQRHKRQREAKALDEWNAGLITIDEYREATGKEPMELAGTRALYVNGIAIPRDDTDSEAIKGYPAVPPVPAPGGGAVAAAPSEQLAKAHLTATRDSARSIVNAINARFSKAFPGVEIKELPPAHSDEPDDIEPHPYIGMHTIVEGQLDAMVAGWDDDQEKVTVQRLSHAKVRKHTKHWDPAGTKALDPYYILDAQEWVTRAKQSVSRVLEPMAYKEARRAAREMQDSGLLAVLVDGGVVPGVGKTPFEKLVGGQLEQKAFVDSTLNPVYRIVEKAALNQSQRITKMIHRMDDEGATLKQIETEIRKQIGQRGQWRRALARNVTTAAIEGIYQSVYGVAGNLAEKTWHTMEDEKVRLEHYSVDGHTMPGNKGFRMGSYDMRYPGDPTAPPHLSVNCRCWLSWQPSSDIAKLHSKERVEVFA